MAANPDILKVLTKLLAQTPEYAHYCRPLPRTTVASIVEEIQMLRDQVAAVSIEQTLATTQTPER